MDRPVEKWHVTELRRFLRDNNVSMKGLKVKAQFVEKVKQSLQRKSVTTDDAQNGNQVEQMQAQPQAKKSDTDLRKENEEKFRFLPPEKDMNKSLDNLPPFTFNSIVKYIRNSGNSIQQSPDYMVVKPFERGVNFFIEGYLHNVLAKWHVASETFYFRAFCYRSLRKNEAPHKLRLAISSRGPLYKVLGSSCTCVAGALGFCNHAIGLMYLVSHYYMTKVKLIPDNLACTSLPQQWHKPRGKTISSEPLMDMVFKKPKLDLSNMESTSKKSSPGIACSLYPAIRVAPSNTEIENFKASLQGVNKTFGLSLYMDVGVEMVPTKVGPAPLGGYLSYQLAPTEGNFEVTCNVDLSRESTNNLPLTIYPPFPLSLSCPTFTITQCPAEHQPFIDSLQLSEGEAATLEKETVLQRNNSRWWAERRPRITASRFGEVLSCRSVSSAFLKGLVGGENTQGNSSNLPAPLKHGIEHESTALEQYENYLKHSGHPVKTFPSGFAVNPVCPFLGCSPDGKVIDKAEQDDPFGIIEIKCPYKHRNVTPETATSGDPQFHLGKKDDFPVLKTSHRYYYQVQGQMGITGAKWCDFITYTFKGMVIERILFDADFFASMLLKLEQFFFKHFAKHVKQQAIPECAMVSTSTVTASTSTSSSTE